MEKKIKILLGFVFVTIIIAAGILYVTFEYDTRIRFYDNSSNIFYDENHNVILNSSQNITYTPFSKKICEGDQCSSKFYLTMKFFNNGSGWREIDPTLIPYNQDGYSYKSNYTPYEFYAKSGSNFGDGIKYCVDGSCLTYQAQDMSYRDADKSQDYIQSIASSTGEVNVKKINYPNVFPNTNLTYSATNQLIKQEYVITELPQAPANYLGDNITLDYGGYIKFGDLDLYAEGIERSEDFVTSERIEFRKNGETMFYLPKPIAYDSNGSETDLEYEVDFQNNQVWFYIRTSFEWLNASDRVYPVYIDPTIYYPNSAGSTAYDWGGDTLQETGSLSQTGEEELSSAELNSISDQDDGTGYFPETVAGTGGIRIAYNISETSVTEIRTQAKGTFTASGAGRQYIWNATSTTWETLSQDTASPWVVNDTITTTPEDYVVDGFVHTAVEVFSSIAVYEITDAELEVDGDSGGGEDTTNPSVISLTEFPSDHAFDNETLYEFNATITDDTALDIIILDWDGTNYTATNLFGDVYNVSFSSLSVANYTYTWYANDTSGNVNNTEGGTYEVIHNITIEDTTPPLIEFVSPTPADATSTTNTSVEINTSITESSLGEVKYNWNGTNYTFYNNSLKAMFNFDDYTRANDTSINENDGTISGNPQFVSGKYGGAYDFDGSGDSIDTTYEGISGSNPRTVAFWTNGTSSTDRRIVGWGESANGEKWHVTLNHNSGDGIVGALRTEVQGGYYISSTDLRDGDWHFAVVTFEGTSSTDIKHYIDGVLDSQSGVNAQSVNTDTVNGENVRIGGMDQSGTDEFYDGAIDEVRIWDRALTADEISQLYMSNFYKYGDDDWALYVNQSKNATDGLSNGTYTYQSFASDSAGNTNSTEERTLTIGEEEAEDPCTVPNSGDWTIDAEDCVIDGTSHNLGIGSTVQLINGANLTVTNNGLIQADTFIKSGIGGRLRTNSGGRIQPL